jgi:1,4-dihydroxy-2-naphthoyl-CoA hydrolase
MPFTYPYTIQFRDTDAAGVVYFANVLAICHAAYEASLVAAGIDLQEFFRHPDFAVPVVRAEADFRRPMYCGESYQVQLVPRAIAADRFAIAYTLSLAESAATVSCKAATHHVAIHPQHRHRIPLPDPLQAWLERLSSPTEG